MRVCHLCGATKLIERHHVFGGARRKTSEANGFVVDLCHYCHNEPPNGAHHNRAVATMLKREAQTQYELTHTRAQWMALIGRNYRED
jgi:hypothetical protein